VIRVLLVDDHAVVRMGFRLLLQLNEDIKVVAEAESGEAACQCYLELAPDVVVMDLAMPGMGGLEALRRIRARHPQAKVLALSAHDDLMHARRTLQEGAFGFLSKRSAPETLLEAVSTVAAGRRYIDPDLAQRLALAEFDERPGPPSSNSRNVNSKYSCASRAARPCNGSRRISSYRRRPSGPTSTTSNKNSTWSISRKLTLIAIRHGLIEA